MAQRTAEERFWEKVDTSGGPGACWPWTASADAKGYGRFNGGDRVWAAPRWLLGHLRGHPLAWSLGLREEACHHCDNPPCVNPAHLYIGDPIRNAADAVERGLHSSVDRRAKERCKRGHLIDGVQGNGRRICSTCKAETTRRQREGRADYKRSHADYVREWRARRRTQE